MSLVDETMLLRQVNPAFIQNGVISSQVYKPTKKDNDKLSMYNGDKFTAEDSFNHFLGLSDTNKSSGVVGVTKAQCDTVGVPSLEDNDPFDRHCHLDFTDISIKSKSKLLKAVSINNGWLFEAV